MQMRAATAARKKATQGMEAMNNPLGMSQLTAANHTAMPTTADGRTTHDAVTPIRGRQIVRMPSKEPD
ncbi:MAG: hypothetical protein QOD99_676 [Chthoniobacter sp.]|jgi:hypothetical protein|nr:hypothetical protein [Chthoniobacter sp.]